MIGIRVSRKGVFATFLLIIAIPIFANDGLTLDASNPGNPDKSRRTNQKTDVNDDNTSSHHLPSNEKDIHQDNSPDVLDDGKEELSQEFLNLASSDDRILSEIENQNDNSNREEHSKAVPVSSVELSSSSSNKSQEKKINLKSDEENDDASISSDPLVVDEDKMNQLQVNADISKSSPKSVEVASNMNNDEASTTKVLAEDENVDQAQNLASTQHDESSCTRTDEKYPQNTNIQSSMISENDCVEKENSIQEHLVNDQNMSDTNNRDIQPVEQTDLKGDEAKVEINRSSNKMNHLKSVKADDNEEDGSKERVVVNYAHKSAGALVLEKSSSFKGTSNLLTSDNDKYAIAPCDDKKYVVVGLSEDILVKQIVLANFERFSSHVQDFQLLGSQTYPMGNWHDLGTYTARPGNGIQTFDLVEPSWARYLQFKFVTHYGEEHYCTVSQIKVHGSTMLQGFHEQWTQSEKEEKEMLEEKEEDETAKESVSFSQSNLEQFKSEDINYESDTAEKMEMEISHQESVHPESSENDKLSEIEDDQSTGSNIVSSSTRQQNDTNSSMREETSNFDHDNVNSDFKSNEVPNIHILHSDNSDSLIDGEENKIEIDNPTTQFSTLKSNSKNGALSDSSIRIETKGVPKGTTKVHVNIETSEEYENNFEKLVITGALSDAVSRIRGGTITVSEAVKKMTEGSSVSYDTMRKLTIMVKDVLMQQLEDQTVNSDLTKEGEGVSNSDESTSSNVLNKRLPEKSVDVKEEISKSTENDLVDRNTSEESTEVIPGEEYDIDDVNSGFIEDGNTSKLNAIETNQPDLPKVRIDVETEEKPQKVIPTDTMNQKNVNTGSLPSTSLSGSTIIKGSGSNIRNESKNALPSSNNGNGISCFDLIGNFNELKARRIAQKQAKMNPSSAAGIEPIFKTLTDEIKALQLHQSIYEEHIKDVVDCFQTVTMNMSKKIGNLEADRDQRISNLEYFMNDFIEKQEKSQSHTQMSGISSITLATAASNSIHFFLSKAIPLMKKIVKYFYLRILPVTTTIIKDLSTSLLYAFKKLVKALNAEFLKFSLFILDQMQCHGYLSSFDGKIVDDTLSIWLNVEVAFLGIMLFILMWQVRPRRRLKSNRRMKKKKEKSSASNNQNAIKDGGCDKSQRKNNKKKPRIKIEED